MDKKTSQMMKGIAILIMIAHHFIVMSFLDLPYLVTLFGEACKICVAIYAVLSGYGYYFVKEKTIKYGLKKIWGLLQIYWISLFTLFIPAALLGGWEMTPWNLIVQLFGLLPNLNWFAWYVFFYVFCMLVMPILFKYNVFRFKSFINLIIMIFIPYILEVILYMLCNYKINTIIHDLYSCFLYFPCFLIGYWIADNKMIEKFQRISWLQNPMVCIMGIILVLSGRTFVSSLGGFLLDVFYAPTLIILILNLSKKFNYLLIGKILSILGKYSTGMWFFHAVFFSTYIGTYFKPILEVVSFAPIMFIWLVLLSLVGAYCYQKILEKLNSIFNFLIKLQN